MTRRAIAACAATLAIAGCGGGDEVQRDTKFRRALGTVGTAVSPIGTGFGWVDVERVREESGAAALVADAGALGPGGDQLFEEASRVERQTGVDPLGAKQALSLGGSYMFAVRFDGESPGRLPNLLHRAGARRRAVEGSTGFDLGEQGQAATTGPLSALDALAARTAIGGDSVVLSRMDGARASLVGAGGSVLHDESLDFASACLGEVSAARTFPGRFAHNPVAAPDLMAVGARAPDVAGRSEVLCAIDDSEEDAERRATGMEEAFGSDARDAVTGEPMARLVDETEIEMLAEGELHAARAELTLTPAARRGLLFDALGRGSLATYTGSPAPLPDEP